jgi:hypothetical protein
MMAEFEMGEDGFLHQKGRNCMLCISLKDNKNNDGYNCKHSNISYTTQIMVMNYGNKKI